MTKRRLFIGFTSILVTLTLVAAVLFKQQLPLETQIFAHGKISGLVQIRYLKDWQEVMTYGELIEYSGNRYLHCSAELPNCTIEVYTPDGRRPMGIGLRQNGGLYRLVQVEYVLY